MYARTLGAPGPPPLSSFVAPIVVDVRLNWPPESLLGSVLLAAVVIGLLPVILLALNRLVQGGGSIAVPGVLELAFQAALSDSRTTRST